MDKNSQKWHFFSQNWEKSRKSTLYGLQEVKGQLLNVVIHVIYTQIPNTIQKKILLVHFEGAKTTKYSYFGENTRFPYISEQNQCKFLSVTISIKDLKTRIEH